MSEHFLITFLVFSFLISFLTWLESEKVFWILSALNISVCIWLGIYFLQPYRVKQTYIKEVDFISNVQMISYVGQDDEIEFVNLNKTFGRVIAEYERVRISILDDGYYVGIFPTRVENKVEIIKPGEALKVK